MLQRENTQHKASSAQGFPPMPPPTKPHTPQASGARIHITSLTYLIHLYIFTASTSSSPFLYPFSNLEKYTPSPGPACLLIYLRTRKQNHVFFIVLHLHQRRLQDPASSVCKVVTFLTCCCLPAYLPLLLLMS